MKPVGVVGGGVGGLGAAIALAKQGIPTVVYEKSAASHEIDRGDVIHSRSHELLTEWGAWESLRERGALRVRRFRILNESGSRLVDLDLNQTLSRGQGLWALRHSHIVEALREFARSHPGIELREGTAVLDLMTSQGQVVGVLTRDGECLHPLTVVADGARSRLRDRHFHVPRLHDWDRSFFNVRVKGNVLSDPSGVYVVGSRGILIMLRLPNGETRIGLQYPTSDSSRKPTVETFWDHASQVFVPFKAAEWGIIDAHSYRLRSSFTEVWNVPGAVLLGDCAHTVHPTGGQGMNLAFGDAQMLADSLRDDSEDFARAARSYAHARKAQSLRVYRRCMVGGQLAGITDGRALWARSLGLRLLGKMPPAQKRLVRRLADVR